MKWLKFYKYEYYAIVMNLTTLIVKVALAYLCFETSWLETCLYFMNYIEIILVWKL